MFNYTSKLCTKCLTTEVYSPSTRLCEINYPVVFLTNVSAGNLVGLTSSLESIVTQNERILKGNPKAYLCSADTPYAGKESCIACRDSTPLFDMTTKECTSCKETETYNPKLYRCEETVYFTNLDSANLANLPEPLEKLKEKLKASLDRSPRFKVCQDPTPFANKTACIGCTESNAPLFDMTELKCVGCRDNETYNPKSYRCEATVLLTNFNAGKFVNLPDKLENLIASQKTQTDASPRYKVCD